MTQNQSPSVHRYFEPADSFVEIRLVDPQSVEYGAPQSLDRRGYRRFVIQTCMPQFDLEVTRDIEQLFPEDPLLAEDLLYTMCIEANPALDIHKVELRDPLTLDLGQALAEEERKSPKSKQTKSDLVKVARTLRSRLGRRIHGQADAIGNLCSAVEKAAAGLAPPERPLGCFLFVGGTGTGKTELARRLAKELAGDCSASSTSDNLIRIDCSEYALAHDYSKLIGSPPGYVGHDEGGQLTRRLAERPGAVVLFDEIEKAHPRMHNLLLQVLEDGALTDGRGNQVSFEEHFIILTSNAGSMDIRNASRNLGFHRGGQLGCETLEELTIEALERQFSPEFLGRLDSIVHFSDLDKSSARSIAADQLTGLAIRARRRGLRVSFTAAVARWVVERGFTPALGARELRHVIQREVEPSLAQLVLSGEVEDQDLIRARIRGGKLEFSVER
ncbi:MAG: AAA family ATPase [bacterium]